MKPGAQKAAGGAGLGAPAVVSVKDLKKQLAEAGIQLPWASICSRICVCFFHLVRQWGREFMDMKRVFLLVKQKTLPLLVLKGIDSTTGNMFYILGSGVEKPNGRWASSSRIRPVESALSFVLGFGFRFLETQSTKRGCGFLFFPWKSTGQLSFGCGCGSK